LPATGSASPSDEAVLALLKANCKLRSVRIVRAWCGIDGGDASIGRRLIEACGPALRSLTLTGEIFDSTLFEPCATLRQVRAVTLLWYKRSCYRDILAFLESGASPRLTELSAHNEGFDGDDRGEECLLAIRQLCDQSGIVCSVGALFGCVSCPSAS